MGVVHSLEEEQVQKLGSALHGSATAIQGINVKFDEIDQKWTKVTSFNSQMNEKIEGTVLALERMDTALNGRIDMLSSGMVTLTEELAGVVEGLIKTSSHVDINRHVKGLPAALIPVAIPMVVLLVELAVANAYMGILLTSVPEIRKGYSRYLLVNALTVLMGLTLSLLWLIFYRIYAWRAGGAKREKKGSSDPELDEFHTEIQNMLGHLKSRTRMVNSRVDESAVSSPGSLQDTYTASGCFKRPSSLRTSARSRILEIPEEDEDEDFPRRMTTETVAEAQARRIIQLENEVRMQRENIRAALEPLDLEGVDDPNVDRTISALEEVAYPLKKSKSMPLRSGSYEEVHKQVSLRAKTRHSLPSSANLDVPSGSATSSSSQGPRLVVDPAADVAPALNRNSTATTGHTGSSEVLEPASTRTRLSSSGSKLITWTGMSFLNMTASLKWQLRGKSGSGGNS